MNVVTLEAAKAELLALPLPERKALENARLKLETFGTRLGYPHTSQVKGFPLRELRPRQGRSPWRALYQVVGDALVIAAIAPEALHDPRGFQRAATTAIERIEAYAREQGEHES